MRGENKHELGKQIVVAPVNVIISVAVSSNFNMTLSVSAAAFQYVVKGPYEFT